MLTAVIALGLSGCGLIQGMQDPPEDEKSENNQEPNAEETNACGGDEELTYAGEPAEWGDSCGPCMRDTLRCDESDESGNSLFCEPGGSPCRGPQNVEASTDRVGEVLISWEHVSGADEYIVYRDGEEIEKVSAEGLDSGARLEVVDEDATPAAAAEPMNFEATSGDDHEGIKLTWTFDSDEMFPDGPSHDYAVVAVHLQFEQGESDPVEVEGNRVAAKFGDEYQFRRQGGEWINFSGPQCMENECRLFDGVDGQEGPNLPLVTPGVADASQGELDFDVRVLLEEAYAEGVPTEYELRAVDNEGQTGHAAQAEGYVGVDQFTLRFERADQEEADDEDFEVLEDVLVNATFDSDEAHYLPELLIEITDAPEISRDYYYRFVVATDGHHDNRQITEADRGFPGAPILVTASRDQTVRRVFPNGEEKWQYGDFFSAVGHVAIDPEGNVYATGGPPGEDRSVRMIDAEGQEVWRFDDHLVRPTDIAVGPQLNVFVTYRSLGDSHSKLIKIDPDGQEVARWVLEGDDLRAVAVDANGAVYTGATDGMVRKMVVVEEDGQSQFEVVWTVGDEDDDVGAVAVEPDGTVYFGTDAWGIGNVRIHRLSADYETGDASDYIVDVQLFQNPMFDSTDIDDIVITADGRVYVAANPFYQSNTGNGPHGAILRIDFDTEESHTIIAPEQYGEFLSIDVDPQGHLYYGQYYLEKVVKLDEDYEVVWSFDDHAASNPDSSECNWAPCFIHSIAVGPGLYGTFPQAWEDFGGSDGE